MFDRVDLWHCAPATLDRYRLRGFGAGEYAVVHYEPGDVFARDIRHERYPRHIVFVEFRLGSRRNRHEPPVVRQHQSRTLILLGILRAASIQHHLAAHPDWILGGDFYNGDGGGELVGTSGQQKYTGHHYRSDQAYFSFPFGFHWFLPVLCLRAMSKARAPPCYRFLWSA